MNEVKKEEKEISEKEKMDNLKKIIIWFIAAAVVLSIMNKDASPPEKEVVICIMQPGLFGMNCDMG